jgi:bacillithiol biosynthesis cysteine-adding enzyme BshC
LVHDYLSGAPVLKSFYKYETNKEGFAQAIKDRASYPVNRSLLVDTLRKQYKRLGKHDKVISNIDLLLHDNTFTVCTAHQPNLATGYLYFVYKILHAIKLSEELKHLFPHQNFIPVYYMGSEDNDLEELGSFRYDKKKFAWDGADQQGAVGRMKTESLKPLLDELFKQFGPPGPNCEELTELLTRSYLEHSTIAEATRYLVNELFGRYGLIVINPDETSLKREFIDVMKDDLLNHTAYDTVTRQISSLAELHKVQAHPRPINLFYLTDNLRERIEKVKDSWVVLNTSIRWTEDQLLAELESHPERFSPNVILRGLFQETILPDVAFIGGGAELAYWLQLKTLFEQYKVFFPPVHLRQSILWVHNKEAKLREQLGLSVADVFKPETDLIRQYIVENGKDDWQTDTEMKNLEHILQQLRQKAVILDPTLRASAEAALAKIRYQGQVLEKKMLRAEKRKMQDKLAQIVKLKTHLFPSGGLQERVENFMGYYLEYGSPYFDILKDNINPLDHQFVVVEERS